MHVKNRRTHALRSRSNPLVRASDRVEGLVAVILLAAGFAAIGLAVWLGGTVADSVRASDSRWLATSYPAVAVATDSGRVTAGPAGDGASSPWLTHVTWTDPDGASHNGVVATSRPVPLGAPVQVRVDEAGWPRVAEPSDPGAAGVVVGAFALLTSWFVLGLLWVAAENLVLRHNLRQWDIDWRRACRQWS
ncbi:MAG TPA: hypothetical protein VL595_28650 [Pseudonocardia sp.]|jgi:hypothetical protein|nr:hypothetical protein [Pseudonocardia sp.]